MLQGGSVAEGTVRPFNHPGRRTREPSYGRFWKRGSGPSWETHVEARLWTGLEQRRSHAKGVPTRGHPRCGRLSVTSHGGRPPLTHPVLARWREHSGHSGRMGPFRGSAAGLSPTKPPLLPSFLDLQPVDERGPRSAPVGCRSPGAGCGNRPPAWGWADVPGTPSVTEGGGRAPRSGCGLAAPAPAARAGFHSSRASPPHDLPPKSSRVAGLRRGLSVRPCVFLFLTWGQRRGGLHGQTDLFQGPVGSGVLLCSGGGEQGDSFWNPEVPWGAPCDSSHTPR